MDSRTGPLRDVKIIDCTQALSGPFGTALLADLGADVIKIEPPTGDLSRGMPPHPPDFAGPLQGAVAGCDYGGYFASINRNKRSLVLDLKQENDRVTLMELVDRADVFVENARVGVMDRLGVGYENLSARNPRLVYACIRGFGDPRTGRSPYAEWPSFDIVAQSMSGVVATTGPEDELGFPMGASIGDIYPGAMLALGIVSAVHAARRDGEGQFVDIAMLDALLSLNETAIANYSYQGVNLGPRGAGHPNLCPFGIFATKDGAVSIAAPTRDQWADLCGVMGRADLVDRPETEHVLARAANRSFVEREVTAWTSVRTTSEIVELLGGLVPVGPVYKADQIVADPHTRIREMLKTIDLPGDNPSVQLAGHPIKFTRTPAGVYRRPPLLDEHRTEVLEEFEVTKGKS